ncbi:PspA/IM30 family protein [Alicyclobacillus sp. ALC3]|uniref:PspA/IM30 family protein n=1 Tax=Alicyclobacillus sp. ALC3 TaxID=2796143 RepID=UPI002378BDBA|nr:PspA/IM30 family protein [Alicyclobacillus sp. ALC3]WDL96881.1 PspA/IM30 family protein [Alicyclobacillus sp. ALC3]
MDWLERVKGIAGHGHKSDPRAVADEVLRELQSKIEQAQQAVVTHSASAAELRSRATEATELASRRKLQATAALRSGDEELARRALADGEKLISQAEAANRLATAEEDQGRALRDQTSALQLELLQLQARRDESVARGDVALLDKSLADVVSGIDARARSFDELEAKSARLELEAAAHRAVATEAARAQDSATGTSDLDEQLRALKEQLQAADDADTQPSRPDGP